MANRYVIKKDNRLGDLCIQRYTRDGNNCYCVAYFRNFGSRFEMFVREKFETIAQAQHWLDEYAKENNLSEIKN